MGKEIKKIPIEKGFQVLKFQTEDFSTGLYLVSMKDLNNNTIVVKKFIVQK